MPEKNITDAFFELKDKKRGPEPTLNPKSRKAPAKPLRKRRSFDTFYLFCVVLLFMALALQVVAIATYN